MAKNKKRGTPKILKEDRVYWNLRFDRELKQRAIEEAEERGYKKHNEFVMDVIKYFIDNVDEDKIDIGEQSESNSDDKSLHKWLDEILKFLEKIRVMELISQETWDSADGARYIIWHNDEETDEIYIAGFHTLKEILDLINNEHNHLGMDGFNRYYNYINEQLEFYQDKLKKESEK